MLYLSYQACILTIFLRVVHTNFRAVHTLSIDRGTLTVRVKTLKLNLVPMHLNLNFNIKNNEHLFSDLLAQMLKT